MNKKKIFGINSFLAVALISVALIGGILGALTARFYLVDSAYYTSPFANELNFLQSGYNRPNLIIRDAKKVVVSQDVKVQETANQARESLVGLFVKQSQPENLDEIDIKPVSNYYQLNKQKLTGLIITADGWIMLTSDDPKDLKNLPGDYVVVNQDREIYEIDEIIEIEGQPILLAHLEGAQNLKPMSFMKFDDLSSGQSLLALNWQDEQVLVALVNIDRPTDLVKGSEDFFYYLSLTHELTNLEQILLFNLNGEAIAFRVGDDWIPFNSYSFIWQSALVDEKIFLPVLGINYVNLSEVAQATGNHQQGALVYADSRGVSVLLDSPAQEAGLVTGDIIRAVDSIELNEHNDLAQVLSNYQGGQEIDLTILRGDVLEVKIIILGNQE